MFGVRELNVSIELWGVAFSLIGMACSLFFARFQMRFRSECLSLFVFNLIAAGGDVVAGVYQGVPGALAWFGSHLGNYLTFSGGFLLVAGLTSYLTNRLRAQNANYPNYWNAFVMVAAACMCVLTAFGLFYHIDEQNVYHRNDLYWVSNAFVIFVSLANATFVLSNRSRFDRFGLFCMMFYTLSPTISAIMQINVHGINFYAIVSTLGLVLIFLEMQAHSATVFAERTEDLARSQVELSERRIAAMVSQIQPHFIFNTLDTIYGLCDEDVELTKDAIASFSRYLRMNLTSLRRSEPVPIATEMKHVRTYLELEQLSDKSRLSYELSMDADDFAVPALCVQTMVENAVKHGLGKREKGGTVWVSTKELKDEYVVRIEDNGVGFDAGASFSAGDNTHVGIENTKTRLAEMCDGSLDIASVPNKGTTVIIRIPKEERA